jgi:type I restriction enzyme S subunit
MKWERKTINELCEIKGGKRLPKNHELIEVETNHPYIRARDIGNGIIDFSKPVYLQENTFNFISRYTVKADDIVLTIVGANIGDVGLIPKHLDGANLTENAVKLTSFNENCHFKYLLYYFLLPGKKKQLEQVAAGSAQGKLGLYKIKDIEVPIPPLPTQRKIASILSAYDDLIENNLKRIKLLEEKAFVSYKLLVKSEKFKLEELYDTSSGGTPSRTNAEYFTGEINWFKSKELADSILLESEEKITEQAVDKSSAKLFPAGSVIMAMYGATIGKLGLLSQPSTTNQACCAIIQKDEIQSNYYILNWLIENREYVLSFRMGAAQENISQQIIRNLVVSIPKESDLKIFNQEMQPIYHLIKNLHQQNTKLREARDILLPKLMNGQIEV